MYKPLIAAFLFASACAHAPAAAPKAPEPVVHAAPSAPCVMTPPPEVAKHRLAFMTKPEETEEVTPDGDKVPVVTFRIYGPSVGQFFYAVKLLQDWADETWKACGGGGR